MKVSQNHKKLQNVIHEEKKSNSIILLLLHFSKLLFLNVMVITKEFSVSTFDQLAFTALDKVGEEQFVIC